MHDVLVRSELWQRDTVCRTPRTQRRKEGHAEFLSTLPSCGSWNGTSRSPRWRGETGTGHRPQGRIRDSGARACPVPVRTGNLRTPSPSTSRLQHAPRAGRIGPEANYGIRQAGTERQAPHRTWGPRSTRSSHRSSPGWRASAARAHHRRHGPWMPFLVAVKEILTARMPSVPVYLPVSPARRRPTTRTWSPADPPSRFIANLARTLVQGLPVAADRCRPRPSSVTGGRASSAHRPAARSFPGGGAGTSGKSGRSPRTPKAPAAGRRSVVVSTDDATGRSATPAREKPRGSAGDSDAGPGPDQR